MELHTQGDTLFTRDGEDRCATIICSCGRHFVGRDPDALTEARRRARAAYDGHLLTVAA